MVSNYRGHLSLTSVESAFVYHIYSSLLLLVSYFSFWFELCCLRKLLSENDNYYISYYFINLCQTLSVFSLITYFLLYSSFSKWAFPFYRLKWDLNRFCYLSKLGLENAGVSASVLWFIVYYLLAPCHTLCVYYNLRFTESFFTY